MDWLRLGRRERRVLAAKRDQTTDAATYRRLVGLLALADGQPASAVAEWLGVARQSLYNWVSRYLRTGRPSALQTHPHPGRPPLWNEGCEIVLRASFHQSPEAFGYPAVNWTVGLLQHQLGRCVGQNLAEDTVRGHLHRSGYVWKRPRYVLKPDPQRGAKKRRLREWFWQLPERSVVLFEDETDMVLFPKLQAGWALRGEPARVVLCGANARRVVFGALNIMTGHRLFLSTRRQRAVEFQEFLRLVHAHYRGWRVALILDEDSSHTAKATQALAEELHIELQWLPVRAPELNPLERLWRDGKKRLLANRQYASIEEQTERFKSDLVGLSPQEALIKAGVLSGNFWLFKV
jgi:transposase